MYAYTEEGDDGESYQKAVRGRFPELLSVKLVVDSDRSYKTCRSLLPFDFKMNTECKQASPLHSVGFS